MLCCVVLCYVVLCCVVLCCVVLCCVVLCCVVLCCVVLCCVVLCCVVLYRNDMCCSQSSQDMISHFSFYSALLYPSTEIPRLMLQIPLFSFSSPLFSSLLLPTLFFCCYPTASNLPNSSLPTPLLFIYLFNILYIYS